MKIDSKDIDAAIEATLAAAKNGTFSTTDVLSRLKISPENMEAEELRLERELDADNSLFKDTDKNIYIMRNKFFTGRQFVITPNEIEIENDILFPGHRFCVFCNEDIFPSEITLLDEDNNDLEVKKFSHEVTALMPCHIFMGSEQIFDYFIADNLKNKALLEAKTSQRDVILNVFDMKEFFRKNKFTSGDALLITVKDWNEGVFTFSYLCGMERRNSKVKEWVNELGSAVEMAIDRFEEYLEIPDQLRWAFFISNDLLWGREAGSLDEFYIHSDRIEINFSNASHAVLARKITPQSNGDMDIPDNVAVSSGRISSLGELLEDIDSPLKVVEIDGYIMSQFYNGAPDFDSFFRRCFGMKKLSFADDAQEIIFMNYLEDRWETISSQYNLYDDRPKAQLREQVLEFINERLELLESLKSMDIDPEQLPKKEMKKIAEVSVYFIELLEVLNSENHTLQEEESEEFAEAIGRMGEIQSEQIDKINSYLKI